MLTVIAKCIAKTDKISETKTLLQSLGPITQKEEGCIQYDLYKSNEHPGVFFFCENWESQAALEKHLANDHLVAFKEASEEPLETPMEVFLLNKVEKV